MITMTRRVGFSAAHSDWLPDRTAAENRALFGSHAQPEPYGHNYVLDVSVRGEIDPKTGIVLNIKEIDRIVKQSVVQVLDRKYINKQVAAFHDRPVTPEALLRFIADALRPHLPPEVTLAGLHLETTALSAAEWHDDKDPNMKTPLMMQMTRIYEFAASHRLHSQYLTAEENEELFGKCNYPHGHGHNYVLEITVAGPIDPCSGRVMDETALDTIVNREVVDRYDHRHLNLDIPEFKELIPSSENVTKVIWERLCGHIPAPARLYRVLLRETARNFFEYLGEENPH
ncbi:MAG TPA: 6-carboxytetrahydropterin synthase [Chthonomonadaceae bacterium]|nr:6-carboxytetrahydropterin synthase [Chthonomonadaceae bacterium]